MSFTYTKSVDYVTRQYHNYWHGDDPLPECKEPICLTVTKGPTAGELVQLLHNADEHQLAYTLEAKLDIRAMSEISESEKRVLDGNR